MLEILWLVCLGSLLAEGSGYLWHRYACHVGFLRFLPNDFLRRRHFDHHMRSYPSSRRMRSEVYKESCEIAFKFLAVVALALAVGMVLLRVVSLWKTVAVIAGASIYAHVIIGNLHSLYHVEGTYLTRFAMFRWLRDFHEVHHIVNANYSILLPIFDLLGGSYISPSRLQELKAENLFPRFRPVLSSQCREPVFRR